MIDQIKIPYNECEHLVKEADVLLFRASNIPLTIGWYIAKYGATPYSHVGLANWDDHTLKCLEFREFIGSRNQALFTEFANKDLEIDVYRVPKQISIPVTKQIKIGPYNRIEYTVDYQTLNFTYEVAKKITDSSKKLIGKPYGWKIIYKIAKTLVPFLRFHIKKYYKENGTDLFVCSTLVTSAYRKNFVDLCPFIADEYTMPADLARSAYLNYLFTITN